MEENELMQARGLPSTFTYFFRHLKLKCEDR